MLKILTDTCAGVLLAFVLLAAFSQAALAQSAGNNDAEFLVSGSAEETYELSVHLRKTARVDGLTRLMAAGDCETSYIVEAIAFAGDETGETSAENVSPEPTILGPGETDTFKVDLKDFRIDENTAAALIRISSVKHVGPCGSLLTERLSETSTGTTRTVSNFMSRRAEQLLSTDTAASGGREARILVSGNPADERVELSFLLKKFAMVDGLRKMMGAGECEATISLRADSVSESGGLTEVFFESADLDPGKLHEFNISFKDFESGLALIEVNDVRRTGPCELKTTGRLVKGHLSRAYFGLDD